MNVRVLWVLEILLLAGSPAWTQTSADATPTKIDCPSDPSSAVACHSFNEMLMHHDEEILNALRSPNQGVVCFSSYQDEFTILSFYRPRHLSSLESPKSAGGHVVYSRYKDGVLDISRYVFGQWTGSKDVAPFFTSPEKGQVQASIDNSEIGFSYSFRNINNTTTNYQFQVRNSTLRFSESYSAPRPASGKTSPPPGAIDKNTFTGYCSRFDFYLRPEFHNETQPADDTQTPK